ncbi:hypothetical protein LTR56_023583 [Elasticomyces elasticus]|nr:hypothetical protein LTR56_023583 [Elasticomyces elasticus]KAK3624108.1 hypothetical protein LTR22_024123 [Elasticomyces elasticus]KAK4908636.1 hypothetical protein LTR49_022500 [Elasticomyces elasticus]KAK5733787.1 hypothetical protein LTS12_026867 [Elasticomyces elasticus]
MAQLFVEEYRPRNSEGHALSSIIIFVHGGASSGRMYAKVAPLLLERGYHLILPDLPEHGQSRTTAVSAKQKVFSFDNAVSGIRDVIVERKPSIPGPVTIVGISLGDQVVLALLAQYPELVDRAVKLQEDVERMRMENAGTVQEQSFAFQFDPQLREQRPFPANVGLDVEHDTAMVKRDFLEVVANVQRGAEKSRGKILPSAWHNHSVDVPELFARVVDEWARALEA